MYSHLRLALFTSRREVEWTLCKMVYNSLYKWHRQATVYVLQTTIPGERKAEKIHWLAKNQSCT